MAPVFAAGFPSRRNIRHPLVLNGVVVGGAELLFLELVEIQKTDAGLERDDVLPFGPGEHAHHLGDGVGAGGVQWVGNGEGEDDVPRGRWRKERGYHVVGVEDRRAGFRGRLPQKAKLVAFMVFVAAAGRIERSGRVDLDVGVFTGFGDGRRVDRDCHRVDGKC